jgi:hypothetical protein
VNDLTSGSEVFNDLGVVGTRWPGEGSQVDTLYRRVGTSIIITSLDGTSWFEREAAYA